MDIIYFLQFFTLSSVIMTNQEAAGGDYKLYDWMVKVSHGHKDSGQARSTPRNISDLLGTFTNSIGVDLDYCKTSCSLIGL
jgi:hypothetical protein